MSCVALAWRGSGGELCSCAIPFDQGVREGKHTVGMTDTQRKALFSAMEAEQTRKQVLSEMAGKRRQDTKVYAALAARAEMLQRVSWTGESEELWERLVLVLADKALVAHNAKFDTMMMWKGAPFGWASGNLARRVVWDTLLCSRIIEPVELAALDAIAQRIGLAGKEGKAEMIEWLTSMKLPAKRYDLAPWELVERYVTGDAELTLQVYEDQVDYFEDGVGGGFNAQACDGAIEDSRKKLIDGVWVEQGPSDVVQEWNQFQREMDLFRALLKMESRGIGYNVTASREFAEQTDLEADAKGRQLEQELDLEAATLGAMKDWWVQQGFEEHFPKSAKTGALSAPAMVLEDLVGVVPYVEEWKTYADLRRMSSMYYTGYAEKVGRDGRLRCNYKQGGARSGRLSVDRVNLQAIPRGDRVRRLLKAREGFGLWALDLSQAELRVAAQYAGAKRMLEALASGADMHTQTALSAVPGGAAKWAAREAGEAEKVQWSEARSLGKQANFGCLFTIGPESFQKLIKKNTGEWISLETAQSVVWGWRKLYPEIVQAWSYWEAVAEAQDWVPQLIGTKYEVRSYFDWDGSTGRTGRMAFDESRTGWNRVVQGSIGQFVRLWLVDLWKRDMGVVLTVHDSVYLELPDDRSKDEDGAAVAALEAQRAADWALDLFGIEIPVELECYSRGPGWDNEDGGH